MQKKLPDSLLKYSKQWCVREGVDANVLHPWLHKNDLVYSIRLALIAMSLQAYGMEHTCLNSLDVLENATRLKIVMI